MIDVKGIPLQRLRSLPPMPRYSGLNELGGAVKFYIGVNLSVDEMRDWSSRRITDFFEGVAKIITARGIPQ